jgi:twitching motility protein PilU
MVAQQLVATVDGEGRRAAIEVLINSPLIADMIRKGEVHMMKEIMTKSSELGMQTFDQALFKLYRDGEISYESALAAADSANDLRLLIKLSGGEVGSQQKPHGLSLEANEDDTGISLNT